MRSIQANQADPKDGAKRMANIQRERGTDTYVCTIRKLTLYLCVLNTRCEMQKGNNKKRILLSCCCGGCKNVHERATNSRAKAKGAADSSNNNYNVELK